MQPSLQIVASLAPIELKACGIIPQPLLLLGMKVGLRHVEYSEAEAACFKRYLRMTSHIINA